MFTLRIADVGGECFEESKVQSGKDIRKAVQMSPFPLGSLSKSDAQVLITKALKYGGSAKTLEDPFLVAIEVVETK